MNDQVAIRLVRRAEPLSIEAVARLPHLGAACSKCAEWGGLNDKVVCIETGIDGGLWSRIKQGQANPSDEFMDRLMDAAGNEAPLWYQLLRRHYDPASLRKLQTELERRVQALESELAEERKKREVITEFMREVRP